MSAGWAAAPGEGRIALEIATETYAEVFDGCLTSTPGDLAGGLQPPWTVHKAEMADQLPDLPFESGAKGNRTPDLLDANETRYQLRYSP